MWVKVGEFALVDVSLSRDEVGAQLESIYGRGNWRLEEEFDCKRIKVLASEGSLRSMVDPDRCYVLNLGYSRTALRMPLTQRPNPYDLGAYPATKKQTPTPRASEVLSNRSKKLLLI